MSCPNEPRDLRARIRVIQIIATAIAMGALIFLVVVLIVRSIANMPQPPRMPLITYIALGFAAIQLLVFAIVPRQMAASGRTRIATRQVPDGASVDDGDLCNLYSTTMIVGLALLEGVTLFLWIAYLLEGQVMSLLAGGVLLVLIVLQFPTTAR